MPDHLEFTASPEQNQRFMDAMADSMAIEQARHDSERFKRVVTAHRHAGTLAVGEDPQTLEELGYGLSWHNIMTRDLAAEIAAAGPLEPQDDDRRAYEGNVLVENGHAWYAVANDTVFKFNAAFAQWGRTWLAEEHPHGPSAEAWGWLTGYIDTERVDAGTQGYIRNGLTLRFVSAADALAYPALQEPATEITHREVMRRLPKSSESIAAQVGRRIFANIIADERAHAILYRNMVLRALESGDPEIASFQMQALARATLGFSMPGMESDIPGHEEITRAYSSSGVFTMKGLAERVLLPGISSEDKHNYALHIADCTDLNDEGKAAQAQILEFAENLQTAVDSGRDLKIGAAIGRARRIVGQVA